MAVVSNTEVLALDANFLVAARKTKSKEAIRLEHWLQVGYVVHVSAIAWSEYLCGPADGEDTVVTRKFITAIEPFTEEDAKMAGELFNQTGRRSRSHADCMIAAHAIRREAALATLNVQNFQPFKKFGLRLA